MGQHSIATIVTIVEAVYFVVLSAWILLEKRQPAATLAWILSLMALPGVGFVIYFFFGPRRVKKSRLRRLRAQQAIGRPAASVDAITLSDSAVLRDITGIVRIGEAADKARPSLATRVQLLIDGKRTFDALLEAVRSARHHVHVLYYIYEPDQTGTALRDALIERAQAGVQVRVLVDAVGSVDALGDGAFFAPLREAGGEVAAFNPLRLATLWARVLNFRNHRKIVVVDGRIGFTGGINVTDEENEQHHPSAWRDTHLRLEGPVVDQLQLVFLEDWYWTTRRALNAPELFYDGDAVKGTLVQVLDSGPDKPFEPIRTAYFAAINAAVHRVLLTTAYFVPDEPMLLALRSAALRGVDVRVLLPSKSDSRTVSAAARSYYDSLMAAGVRIYEYQPRMLHAKTLVVDDWFAAVGTANFDNRSFRLNFEVSALVFGPELAGELGRQFELDLEQAKHITATSRVRLPFGPRLFEATARVLSPLL
jgi:cardiolipin synthase